MKTLTFSVCGLVLSGAAVFGQTPSASVSQNVVDRGQHFKVVETVRASVGANGATALKTNRYTVVQNGLNRKNEAGQWIECQPEVRRYADALVCTGAAFRVVLNDNLNSKGAVDLKGVEKGSGMTIEVFFGFCDGAAHAPQAANRI